MKTIILDATTKSLQAVMSGAAATTNPDFTCSWADNNGTTFTEGSTDGALNGTTPVTLAAAPASSTRRTIKSLTIQNRDTAAVTVTLQYNNNSTLRQICKFTLAIDDTLTLENTYDANGQMKTVSTTGTVNLATSVTGTLPVANGGTGVTSSTGTVAVVLSTSPTLVTPLLGTPTSGTLTNCTGLPIAGLVASTSTAIGVGSVELGHASDTTLTRVSAGVIAVEGVNVLTIAGGTLTGNITLGENTSIALDPAGSADGKYTGITVTGVAGETLAFGDLVYLKAADSRWWLTDADASATGGPVMIGMCVVGGNAAATVTLLLQGIIRADAAFPALTIGAPVYLGETAGDIQVAIPTGADNVIRVVGFAMTADEIYLNPSPEWQITVA